MPGFVVIELSFERGWESRELRDDRHLWAKRSAGGLGGTEPGLFPERDRARPICSDRRGFLQGGRKKLGSDWAFRRSGTYRAAYRGTAALGNLLRSAAHLYVPVRRLREASRI